MTLRSGMAGAAHTAARGTTATTSAVGPSDRPRFMSEADCRELLERVKRLTSGGGSTTVQIQSTWTGNIRWARNKVITSGDVRDNTVGITRVLNGALNTEVTSNDTTTAGLLAAVRRAERLARLDLERPDSDLMQRYPLEQPLVPKLFSETTYQLDAEKRQAAAIELSKAAKEAGMLSAGYIEVQAHSLALLDTYGRSWYFPYTTAQYSVTVRDPKGTGSGWAGVDWYDWAKIDGAKLSAIALDKCLRSRNAVKIEPGRYTVILEPQAVADLVGPFVRANVFDRAYEESPFAHGPFFKEVRKMPELGNQEVWFSVLGEQVIDKRLSMGTDPLDPMLGFPGFSLINPVWNGNAGALNKFHLPAYHPIKWIENGVLVNLSYPRDYALTYMGTDTGYPTVGAFRLEGSGPKSTVEEMIASTKRGIWVTRFDQVAGGGNLCRGHTRDGLWLIENGKVSKAIKNMYFVDAVLSALNSVEAIGESQRAFFPLVTSMFPLNPQPVVVPPLKIRDFNFSALDDAV